MGDLAIGYAIMALLAAGLFFLACETTKLLTTGGRNGAAITVVVLLFVYIETLWDDVRLVRVLPLSNLIVVGNWLPLFAAFMAGIVWQHARHAPVRRALAVGHLAAAGMLASLWPILGTAPHCSDRWDKLGTCLQTTNYTCSPAAAATLLRRHGIAASEREMAQLCLTRKGTSWQGLYRGLKYKTAGTPWDVELCCVSAESLTRDPGGPMILSVGLDRSHSPHSEYTREFGWVPGVNHSVVLERASPAGYVVIADPAIEMSREHWDSATLETLWRGYALRLVPR